MKACSVSGQISGHANNLSARVIAQTVNNIDRTNEYFEDNFILRSRSGKWYVECLK